MLKEIDLLVFFVHNKKESKRTKELLDNILKNEI